MSIRPVLSAQKRKRPVWVALADLYLDTELSAESLASIAATLGASGFSWPEIKAINYDEVAPALWFNVQDIAGEWAGWNEDWLVERIIAIYTGHRKTLGFERLWQRQVDFFTQRYMAAIAAYLA